MTIDKLSSLLCRVFFVGAFVLLGVAILEKLLNLFGFTLSWVRADASRLLEFATILLAFVVTLLVREVRDSLRKG